MAHYRAVVCWCAGDPAKQAAELQKGRLEEAMRAFEEARQAFEDARQALAQAADQVASCIHHTVVSSPTVSLDTTSTRSAWIHG